jgi:hypothetical protein
MGGVAVPKARHDALRLAGVARFWVPARVLADAGFLPAGLTLAAVFARDPVAFLSLGASPGTSDAPAAA